MYVGPLEPGPLPSSCEMTSEPSRTAPRRRSSDFSIERILARDAPVSVTSTTSQACCSSSSSSSSSKVTRTCTSFLQSGSSATFAENNKLKWIDNCDEQLRRTDDRARKDKPTLDTLGNSTETIKQTDHSNFQRFNGEELSWLRCTRYCPPKLPRKSCAGKNFKRKPGSHPRIPFTKYQLDLLEEKYKNSPYLSRKDVVCLTELLQLPQSRIKIWFQNRRARARRESQLLDQTH